LHSANPLKEDSVSSSVCPSTLLNLSYLDKPLGLLHCYDLF
jgi:hypothetical protein